MKVYLVNLYEQAVSTSSIVGKVILKGVKIATTLDLAKSKAAEYTEITEPSITDSSNGVWNYNGNTLSAEIKEIELEGDIPA